MRNPFHEIIQKRSDPDYFMTRQDLFISDLERLWSKMKWLPVSLFFAACEKAWNDGSDSDDTLRDFDDILDRQKPRSTSPTQLD